MEQYRVWKFHLMELYLLLLGMAVWHQSTRKMGQEIGLFLLVNGVKEMWV